MADDFRDVSDKKPIIYIKHWSFAIREIILAVVAIVLLLLCIILAGLLGGARAELSESTPSASAVIERTYCETKECLDTAARAVDFMNKSVDPCEDFYQYACGNYKNVKPITPNQGSRTPLNDMVFANEEKITNAMEQPIKKLTDWSSERKLKHFFQSCNDMYTREKLRGKPFLDKVVSVLGGWDVIGTWNEDSWNFNTALRKVQSDFWTNAFFAPIVGVDPFNYHLRTITLMPSGTGKWMQWSWFTSRWTENLRTDYKKFMRRVGSLLQRDANVNMTQEEKDRRLDQFVNDTYTIEYKIATTAQDSAYRNNPYLDENKVSLNELNSETNNVINWVDQMSYMFKDAGPKRPSGNTRVVVLRREYFRNVTNMITSLPDADRKRMLHNYLIWRTAEIYLQELSWEYVHANREIYVDIYGRAQFLGTYRYCFYLAKTYMSDALGSLYIAEHFNTEKKGTVDEITLNLKKSLQEQLDSTPWMDTATREYAKDKLDKVMFKLGYPEWMANHEVVDQLYMSLTVNVSDFFGTVLSSENLMRSLWAKELRDGEDRRQWIYPVYDPTISVYWYWNEIIAPSAVLQPPIYDPSKPHSITFGSLGSIMGRFLHYIVDDWGKSFDKNGNEMEDGGSWWSEESLTKYKEVDTCVNDVYMNVSKTFPNIWGDEPFYIHWQEYTPRAIAITNGIRLALKSYKKWVAEKGIAEKMIPGLHMTNEQMLFLGHAQVFCYNRNEWDSLMLAYRGTLEEDLQVNNALGQLQEFSDTFQCKIGSKMNQAKKCDYY